MKRKNIATVRGLRQKPEQEKAVCGSAMADTSRGGIGV